ncbi:MAG TPA: DNA-binding protein [Lachnoclostridium phytofermentans]|uniref:DNA-binding protein n=1 Tax=Lachnoclostridium phytofermentans TaxID=66219 RepID=A0A3D2X2G0_9FIRM|nr:DNA-binding protein [Lachnoclostridium sp.]HCL01074.1 DNA-binding protein [Lachnoclostridium phytofermentans]
MDYRRFQNHYVIRLDRGEDIVTKLKELAKTEQIKLATLSGLGACGKVTAGIFDTTNKAYKSYTFEGDFEIVSISGTITTMKGEIYTHFHISVSDENGNVYGGHLNEAIISGTGELVLTVIDGVVEREFSEEIGLNLLKFI